MPLIKVENTAAGWRGNLKETQICMCVSFVTLGLDALGCPCAALQGPAASASPTPPPGLPLRAHFLYSPFPVTRLQLHRPPCWSSNTPGSLLPQDLCAHCSFCLEYLSPRSPQANSLSPLTRVSAGLTPFSPLSFLHMSGKWASLTTLFKISPLSH